MSANPSQHRILFVDDERPLLDGLRARLRCQRTRWEMVFVESGPRALVEMEQRPFDAIVSDVRMPGMDGVALLATAAKRWPQTIRIVLSGYAEEERAARLLSVAHQYLSKPCDATQLENAIDRCFKLFELLQEPRLRALVGRIRRLPALPRVYTQLRAAMSNENVSIHEIADIVASDPAIAAKVLQVVNSSFFRLARRITRIEQAISYLGLAAVRNVVMSVEVFSEWPKAARNPQLQPEHLQASATKLAAVAHALTAGTPIADDAMLAGLLHDIGYWVLLQECPDCLERAVTVSQERSIPLSAAEAELIGASHADIGAYLLGLWGLPHAVVEAVALHHAAGVAHTHFDVLGALLLARCVINHEPAECEAGADPAAREVYLRALHAPFDWDEAQRRAAAVLGESDE